jgi:CelD/BcsL family acetyltransferase involved in cellulose biosynthesis
LIQKAADRVKVEVYDSEAGFDRLRGDWNDLLRRSPTDTIFLTWQWQTLWWQAYHPGELFIAAVHDETGTLIGVAPWFIDSSSPDERVVRGIGCVDVTDYVDIFFDPSRADVVMDALAGALHDHASRFTRINLCNLREASPTLPGLRPALASRGFVTEITEQEVCPVIPLSGSFQAYLESLDKKNRHELRRKIRIAEGNRELATVIVGPDDDLEAYTAQFMDLMADSTEQKAQFLRNDQHVAFFRSILPAAMEQGWLQLAFLTVSGRPAAAYVNFVYNDRVMVYNSGISLEYSHLGPGIILIVNLIRDAAENGRVAFDFLRGSEEYKFRLGGQPEPVFMLSAVRG